MLGAPASEPGLPRQVQSEFAPGQGVLVPDDPVAAVAGRDHDVRDVRPVPSFRSGSKTRITGALFEGEYALLSTFNIYRTGGLAARPGWCRRMSGRGQNLPKRTVAKCLCARRRTARSS